MPKDKPFELDAQFVSSWEGRTWLDWGCAVDENRLREVGGFKFLSYHVFSDGKCSKIRYSSTKSWYHRKTKLLDEIKTYDADIMCLQDVDHYDDWWQPQLMYLGYDSLYKKRTDEVDEHLEGVVIAYKRDLFQLFKTEEVLLNRAGELDTPLVRRRCRTDDVALMAFLQPWRPNFLDSAVCIVSAMLSDHEREDRVDVRFEQARYLTECIESENRSYHLPVIIGMSMHDTPDSAAYHVLRTGRSQLMPKAPSQVAQPIVEAFSRNSVYVKWKPPPTTEADPTILEYTVCWRPGGNLSIGYSLTKKTSAGDCIQYESTVGGDGLRRTVALEYRSMLISNLASETPFEFKVAATNRIGQSEWSRASEPFVMANPPKASPKKPMEILKNYQQVKELCETLQMHGDDWNTQHSYMPNIYDQGTNLTPRTIDGKPDRNIATARVLPLSTNPRQGWKKSMFGEENQQLKAELNHPNRMLKSVIMDHAGFAPSVSDSSASKEAVYEIDPVKYPRAAVEAALGDGDFSDESDGEDKSPGGGGGAQGSVNNNDEESFKFKVKEGKNGDEDDDDGTSVGTASSASSSSSSSSEQDPRAPTGGGVGKPDASMKRAYMRSGINRAQSMALFSSMLESVAEKSSWELSMGEKTTVPLLNPGGDRARTANDDTIFDAKEALETCGAPNKRQVHSLDLRSVYENYGVAGEPLYTTSSPDEANFRGVACKDYIFFTARPLHTTKLLSIPPLAKMSCEDPRESLICPDPYWFNPPAVFESIFNKHEERGLVGRKLGKLEKLQEREIEDMTKRLDAVLRENDGREGGKVWGGTWVPFPTPNQKKTNCWLPNEAYSSSHISLCAHFQINEDNKAAEWR